MKRSSENQILERFKSKTKEIKILQDIKDQVSKNDLICFQVLEERMSRVINSCSDDISDFINSTHDIMIQKAHENGLECPFGVELTWLPKEWDDVRFRESADIWSLIYTASETLETMMKREGLTGYPHPDGTCLEVSSPIFFSMKSFMDYRDRLEGLVRKMTGFKKHSPYIMSGCGHIHVTTSSRTHTAFLLKFISSNPWIGWAMQDTVDDEFAVNNRIDILHNLNMMHDPDTELYVKIVCAPDLLQTHKIVESTSGWFTTDKFTACHVLGPRRVELRQFRAARSRREQEDHVNLAQAMLRFSRPTSTRTLNSWQESRTFATPLDVDYRRPGSITVKSALDRFEHTINLLGLDYNRFHRYSKNIVERFSLGHSYLT